MVIARARESVPAKIEIAARFLETRSRVRTAERECRPR